MSNECPHGNGHPVQKVSAIVSGGTASFSGGGPSGGITFSGGQMGSVSGYTNVSGTTQTALAAKLMPPKKPGFRWFVTLVVIQLSLMAIGGLGSVGAPNGAGNLLVGGISLVLLILLYKGEKSRVAKKTHAYNQMIGRWDSLYYCYRDDLVYDPQTGKAVPPSQMNTLL